VLRSIFDVLRLNRRLQTESTAPATATISRGLCFGLFDQFLQTLHLLSSIWEIFLIVNSLTFLEYR
ncbi:MAG: hypothetical protein MZV63_63735, partial [Marinilabiliales bacterium]|nr:hypothetical protein [Marinilabiliales bacterium]